MHAIVLRSPACQTNLCCVMVLCAVQFSRRSDQEAARKLRQATAENVDQAEALAEDSLDYDAEVVSCGTEAFKKTEYNTHCLIAYKYPSGYESSCSASKIGNNRLATAAHCFYNPSEVSCKSADNPAELCTIWGIKGSTHV